MTEFDPAWRSGEEARGDYREVRALLLEVAGGLERAGVEVVEHYRAGLLRLRQSQARLRCGAREERKVSGRPNRCPVCGSERVVPIVYGYPGVEAAQQEQRGELVLGGCVVMPDCPEWACVECGNRFGRLGEHGPS